MARKRMFSKDVINNDNFIEMPDSSQNLYFHLSLDADDDGFVANYKSIMRMLGKKEDDLKVLIAKQFIIPFENGVLVIRHWKLNNYIQKDRYKETIYKEEKALLSVDNSNVYNLDTNCIHSIDKSRLDKISIDKSSSSKDIKENENDNIFEFIEKIWGITLNPAEFEVINSWEDNELTRHAIKESALNRAYNTKYVEKILRSYKSKGFKSVKDVELHEEQRSGNKTTETPNWFNKENEIEKISEEDKKEMEELLSDFKK